MPNVDVNGVGLHYELHGATAMGIDEGALAKLGTPVRFTGGSDSPPTVRRRES